MRRMILGLVLTLAACSSPYHPSDDELAGMGAQGAHDAIDKMNVEHAGEPGGAAPGGVATIRQAATQTFWTPYAAPAGVMVVIGEDAVSHNQMLVFWRSTDFYCTWYQVGPASGLSGSVTILGSNETWGDFEVPAAGQTKNVYCANFGTSYNLKVPKQAGYLITFQGFGTGNDYFNCSGDGAGCVAYGFGGNDVMESWQSNFTFYGGDGDDRLRTHAAWGSHSIMLGNNGNDCLQSDTTPPAWVNTLYQYDCDWAGMGGDSSGGDKSTGILGTHCNNLVPVGTCN